MTGSEPQREILLKLAYTATKATGHLAPSVAPGYVRDSENTSRVDNSQNGCALSDNHGIPSHNGEIMLN